MMLQNPLQFIDGSRRCVLLLRAMCLIAFALQVHPRYALVLAANRDEFHARPTAAAAFHDDDTGLFGGRDLQAGGGWLLASTPGRITAVTNVRTGQSEQAPRSRGELVRSIARGEHELRDEMMGIAESAADYGRFNLFACERGQGFYSSNHPGFMAQPVASGIHTLSNAALDTPWPKTMHLGRAMQTFVERDDDDPSVLFEALANREIAVDDELPTTGVPLDWERRLSAAFIRGDQFGTRASTVVLVDTQQIRFIERSFGPQGVLLGEVDERIALR